jgi:hypothetical protein
MTTRTHTYLTAAARRARNEAEQFSNSGEGAAAELLLAEIKEAEDVLMVARATIRQMIRPLSVSGYGESMDRMDDALDQLTLLNERLDRVNERLDRGGTRARPHLELVGGDEDDA